MIRSDVHMHTSFSSDSESAPEEMIRGAIEKGLEMICFTDHYDKDSFEWGFEDIFDPEKYFEKMIPLREQCKKDIDLHIGVEIGLRPHLAEYYKEFVNKYPFDFVIGSVHCVNGTDPAAGKLFKGRTDEEVYQMTFEETLLDVQRIDSFDVLGHLDYVIRYGKGKGEGYSYIKYADCIDEILKCLIEKGKGIEMNMSGLKYGLTNPHPLPDVIKRYKELGGEIITIGADAHKPEHIAYDYHIATDILKACGFKYYTEFYERKPIFQQLV